MCEVLGAPSSAERVEQGRKMRKEEKEKRKEEKRRGKKKGKKMMKRPKLRNSKLKTVHFRLFLSLGGDFIFIVGQGLLLHPCMKHNF